MTHPELARTKVHLRLWDLVRHQRHALFEAGLITGQEYVELVGAEDSEPGAGSPSAQRLSDYDELRAALSRRDPPSAPLEANSLRDAIDHADFTTPQKPEDTYMARWRQAVCDSLNAAPSAPPPPAGLETEK